MPKQRERGYDSMHVMAEENAAYRVHVTRDGEQALNCIFGQGQYADTPKHIFCIGSA